MKTAREIQNSITDRRDELDAIIDRAEQAGRDLTEQESTRVTEICDTVIPGLRSQMTAAQSVERDRQQRAAAKLGPLLDRQMSDDGLLTGDSVQPTMRDAHGNPVYCLSRNQKMAATLDKPLVSNGLGEVLRCLVTGKTHSWTPEPVRAALTGTNPLTGGFLVPDELSSMVIDKARAASVIMRAGAMTVPMTTRNLSIARVMSDPEMQVKVQNDAFTEASITFGAIELQTHTIGCLITASRELAEDAPNFAEIIEQVIARALATKLDFYAVQGTGSAMPIGLCYMQDIADTGSIGALAWEDLAAAVSEVRQLNHEPNNIVLGVEPHEDLGVLAGGDGTNSSKQWLGRPPALEGVGLLATNNCPLAFAVAGDYTKALWAIRHDARIELSTEAGEAFERHQIKFKIVFRGDFCVTDPTAFHRLEGITS